MGKQNTDIFAKPDENLETNVVVSQEEDFETNVVVRLDEELETNVIAKLEEEKVIDISGQIQQLERKNIDLMTCINVMEDIKEAEDLDSFVKLLKGFTVIDCILIIAGMMAGLMYHPIFWGVYLLGGIATAVSSFGRLRNLLQYGVLASISTSLVLLIPLIIIYTPFTILGLILFAYHAAVVILSIMMLKSMARVIEDKLKYIKR